MPNAVDALSQLRDIHLPPPIGYWPLAPGWYVLMACVLLGCVGLTYAVHHARRHARAKRQALRLLKTYAKAYAKERNSQKTSAQISELLKRVALAYFPRQAVASLYGEAWLDFLTKTGKHVDFHRVTPLLLEAPFTKTCTWDLDPLLHAARAWIDQIPRRRRAL